MEQKLTINKKSIENELESYKSKPYKCIFEYLWNSFDAGAKKIRISFDLPKEGMGYVEGLKIIDDGKGWEVVKNENTKTFLSSSKSNEHSSDKTLPKGRYGRGRYVFIWVAKQIEIYSGTQKLILENDTEYKTELTQEDVKGTIINFNSIYPDLSDALKNQSQLAEEIIKEFCWFLKQNKDFEIIVNEEPIEIQNNIEDKKILSAKNFESSIQKELGDFEVEIVIWKYKLTEYSKFYFLNKKNEEIFKKNTSLNKKKDKFWHSVYIKSGLDKDDLNNDDERPLFDNKRKQITKKLVAEIQKKLVLYRKPYLQGHAKEVLKELKNDHLIPDLPNFGIYDEESYDDLLKTVYVLTPSLFNGQNERERKFICATLAGLLSNQDNNLIIILLEQLEDLTEEEKEDLHEILQRTRLSNIVKVIKEIDHRLDIINKLEILIEKHKKDTLEFNLQKILDENFWIFGEQFRLFSSTEGSLKNVLGDYAKKILKIENPNLDNNSRKEVDLFLTKTEHNQGQENQKNIIVEIKRPSIELKEDKEYRQIKSYQKTITENSICNGENQYWEYYLIGTDYDDGIKDLIENAKQHGEKNRGLTHSVNNGRIKIYVRKWSDILQAEWGTKLAYLKEELKTTRDVENTNSPSDITNSVMK